MTFLLRSISYMFSYCLYYRLSLVVFLYVLTTYSKLVLISEKNIFYWILLLVMFEYCRGKFSNVIFSLSIFSQICCWWLCYPIFCIKALHIEKAKIVHLIHKGKKYIKIHKRKKSCDREQIKSRLDLIILD